MKKGPGPDWSDEEKAEGEKMSKAWEAYFSEAKSENQNSSAPLTDGEEAKIAQIQAQHEAELLKYPNVVGVESFGQFALTIHPSFVHFFQTVLSLSV